MALEQLLTLVVGCLESVGIPYMLTGSLAASYHGAPRSTQDVDMVVDAGVSALVRLAEQLRKAGLYVSDEAVREASAIRGQFNAIDPESGWKVDFIVKKERPFSEKEFGDRAQIRFLGLDLRIARAEDLVVAKLDWAQRGSSRRQLEDVAQILRVQGANLDRRSVEQWVETMGLEAEWVEAQRISGKSAESG